MGNTKKEEAGKERKGPVPVARNEAQKAKSRKAAKTRRKNESDNITELTRLVPWIPTNPPDKSTTIRLSTSYIGLKKVLNGSRNGHMIGDGCSETQGVESHCMEVLDGFIIILMRDGTITFVNEKVHDYLGFPAHEMMGKKIYNYVLRKDWEFMARKLRGPLPSLDNPNVKEPKDDPDASICEIITSESLEPYFGDTSWNEKIQFSIRMQCNLTRKTNSSKITNFRIVRFTGRINADGFFMGTGEHAWSPDLGDLPVFEPAFMSRLTADLKLVFCEGRIHRYMDSEAKDIVGRVVYPFYHPTDMFYIQKMHSKLLAEGTVTTVPYRWMNKDGGWVWLKSTTTRVEDKKTGRTVMVNVNYVLSAIENKGVVVGVNPSTDEKVIEKKTERENENDSDDAYLVNELTEALRQSNPFGRTSHLPVHAMEDIQDGQREKKNVFNNLAYSTPTYLSPFVSQENETNYNATVQSEQQFEQYSWPQGEPSWQDKSLRNNPLCYVDSTMNEQVLSEISTPNTGALEENVCNQSTYEMDSAEALQLKYIEEQYKAYRLEESYKHQSHEQSNVKQAQSPNVLSDDNCEEMADLTEMPEFSFLLNEGELNQENKAYQACLYLFMNDTPLLESNLKETVENEQFSPSLDNNNLRQGSGFSGNMLYGSETAYTTNISHLNYNNNILPPPNIVDITQLGQSALNGFSEESCIRDFDQTLLN